MPKLIEVQAGTPHELHELLSGVIGLSRKSFVVMGHLLFELKKDHVFQSAIGKGIETWEDYLSQPEISLRPAEANRLMQIYERFVLQLEFDEETIATIPVKNMHYLLPIAKKTDDRDEIEALIYDATNLSGQDFKDRLFEKKKEDNPELDDDHEYMIMKRRVATNAMYRMNEITSNAIKEAFNLD